MVAAVAADAADHLTWHTPLIGLTADDVPDLPDAVVSVSASRGCRSRCTFCAYNVDLGGGWTDLPMRAVVADIAHLYRLSAARFAFADTDFGGTPAACRHRAATLLRELHEHAPPSSRPSCPTRQPTTTSADSSTGNGSTATTQPPSPP